MSHILRPRLRSLKLFDKLVQPPLIPVSAAQKFHAEPIAAHPLHFCRIHHDGVGISWNLQRENHKASSLHSSKMRNRNTAPIGGYVGGRRGTCTVEPAIAHTENDGRSWISATLVPHKASLRKCVLHIRSYPLGKKLRLRHNLSGQECLASLCQLFRHPEAYPPFLIPLLSRIPHEQHEKDRVGRHHRP